MPAKSRNRDMWKAIPWERRAEIAKKIKRMPEGRDKEILRLAFIENLSTADIAERAKTNELLRSRNHKPISKRRVLQIIAENIPDYNAYQDHSQKEDIRKEHRKLIYHNKKTRCALCDSTEKLEWHHMIPIRRGGTTERENMICVCHNCHDAISKYHRKIFSEK